MNKDCCLRYYNPNLAVFIESDASKVGLGSALLQMEKPCYENDITDDTLPESFQLKPVAYASKSLTTVEQNYSNIEHEALGVLHSLEKFHHYCYGCVVHVITDHRPLLSLMHKDVSNVSPRLQRLLLQIYRYHVVMHYRPGKEMHLADYLSRASHTLNWDSEIPGLKLMINDMAVETNVNLISLLQIHDATRQDETLQELIRFIMAGWPSTQDDTPDIIHAFWNYRDELSIVDGIVLKGARIIIPTKLQPQILELLHYAHLGVDKTRDMAKSTVYWPNIHKEIEKMVKNCQTCQEILPTKPANTYNSSPYTKQCLVYSRC